MTTALVVVTIAAMFAGAIAGALIWCVRHVVQHGVAVRHTVADVVMIRHEGLDAIRVRQAVQHRGTVHHAGLDALGVAMVAAYFEEFRRRPPIIPDESELGQTVEQEEDKLVETMVSGARDQLRAAYVEAGKGFTDDELQAEAELLIQSYFNDTV